MLLPLNWLKDFLAKSDIKIDAKELADKLTMRGLQVSAVKRASGLDNVVVARIEKIEPHPNADRLQVTQVVTSAGDGAPKIQIVCGAKNIAEGDIVPLALPGAVLPGNFEIKQSKIRGVDSGGMLCSGKELGLSEDSEGILQLPKHSAIGQPFGRLFGEDETILELELTPNRGDCLSILGLAREAAPLLRTKFKDLKPPKFRISPHRTSAIIKVEVEDAVACPRYVARVIDGLKVAESPDWVKQRLIAVGLKPINNIVDITNLVMIEYGQPLHAFDLRRIESGLIRVAPCKQAQELELLNGQRVWLEAGDILIQDGEKPLALAGIMGGANSQIQPDTTSILLESAVFSPQQIRRTAKRLGLQSDAAKRFERGVDLAIANNASERAAALLRDLFNANVYHPGIDTHEAPPKEKTLAVDMREVRRVTGLKQLASETCSDLLDSIGISSYRKSVNVLVVKIPSHRLDIRESVDIVEEIARLTGYDSIPQTVPLSMAAFDPQDESQYEFESRLRENLLNVGLRETIHYSFTSEERLKRYGMASDSWVALKNPLNEDFKVLRTSLLPSIVESYLYNKNRRTFNQRLFEIARVYHKDRHSETGVRENNHLALLLSGFQQSPHWKANEVAIDFFYMKGLVDILARQMTTVYLAYEPLKDHPLFHPKRSAVIKLGLKEIGHIGEIHPFLRRTAVDGNEPLVIAELNLDALKRYERTTIRFKQPPRYPSVEIDVAVTVSKPVHAASLIEAIRHTGGTLLNDVFLFDLYQGENIPADKKSLAFRLTFLSPDRTLTENEVINLRDRIVQNLSERYGAQLRA